MLAEDKDRLVDQQLPHLFCFTSDDESFKLEMYLELAINDAFSFAKVRSVFLKTHRFLLK